MIDKTEDEAQNRRGYSDAPLPPLTPRTTTPHKPM